MVRTLLKSASNGLTQLGNRLLPLADESCFSKRFASSYAGYMDTQYPVSSVGSFQEIKLWWKCEVKVSDHMPMTPSQIVTDCLVSTAGTSSVIPRKRHQRGGPLRLQLHSLERKS